MNYARILCLLLSFGLATAVVMTACDDDGGGGDRQDTDVQQDADAQQDIADEPDAVVEQDAGEEPDAEPDVTTAGHPETADCATCHAGQHGGAYDWPECNGCHDLPGIPTYPSGHHSEGCLGCHSDADSGSHDGYDSYVPQGCINCHTP